MRHQSGIWTGDRKMLQQTAGLGMVYGIQLFAYQLFILLFEPFRYASDIADLQWITLALHLGMISGAVAWAFALLRFRQWATLNRILHLSMSVSALAMLGLGLFFFGREPGRDLSAVEISQLAALRFVFGFGFSAGLAVALTLIVERLPAFVHTRAGALVMALGMAGPWVAVMLPKPVEWTAGLFWLTAVLLLIPRRFKIPLDPGVSTAWEMIHNPPYTLIRFAFKDATARIFWACVAVGLCVSIFSDLLNLMPRLYPALKISQVYLYRYPGMALGAVLAAWWSVAVRARMRVIRVMLFLQLFVLLLLLWPLFWGWQVDLLWLYTIIFISGLGNGFWLILLLHATEQFPLPYRRFASVLVLAGTRAGGIFLIVFNLLYEWGKGPPWYQVYPGFLLFYGGFFIVIGLVAAPFLTENFEREAVPADLESKPFDGENIRNQLLNLDQTVWSNKSSEAFLHPVRSLFFDFFRRQLGTGFYFTGLFLSERDNPNLFKSGFREHPEQNPPNQAAFDHRCAGRPGNDMLAFHTQIQQLILAEGSKCRPVTWWMLEHPDEIGGVLLWRGGPRQRLNTDLERETNLKHFNLSDIEFTDERLPREFRRLMESEGALKEGSTLFEKLQALYEAAVFPETSWASFAKGAGQDWEEGIKRNLLLHRIDSEAYPPGAYYAHYLPTFNTCNELRGALMVKTAVPLRPEHLSALRNTMTFVLLQRGAALLELGKIDQVMHLQHHFKSALEDIEVKLGRLGHWFSQLNQASRFQQAESMAFAESFVPAFNEVSHLRVLSFYNDYIEKAPVIQALKANPETAAEAAAIEAKYNKIIEIKPVDLKSVLLHTVNSLRSLEWPHLPNPTQTAACFARLQQSVEALPPDLKLQANAILLKVIIFELMKNGLEHADPADPLLEVHYTPGNPAEICFNNNWKPDFADNPAARERFRERFNTGTGFEAGFGLSTVFKYLNDAVFTDQHQNKWKKNCRYSAGMTHISLFVPDTFILPTELLLK